MVSAATARQTAASFPAVMQLPHFDKESFRIGGKIFATLHATKKQASLKLSPVDQSVYCSIRPQLAVPATGAWGKQGWTIFDLQICSIPIWKEALAKAFQLIQPKTKKMSKSSAKTDPKIQTLHPDPKKTNKSISLAKYSQVKAALLYQLGRKELTHLELMEAMHKQISRKFDGSVHWYGETVKLDLEARKLIERTGTKPERYRLVAGRKTGTKT